MPARRRASAGAVPRCVDQLMCNPPESSLTPGSLPAFPAAAGRRRRHHGRRPRWRNCGAGRRQEDAHDAGRDARRHRVKRPSPGGAGRKRPCFWSREATGGGWKQQHENAPRCDAARAVHLRPPLPAFAGGGRGRARAARPAGRCNARRARRCRALAAAAPHGGPSSVVRALHCTCVFSPGAGRGSRTE